MQTQQTVVQVDRAIDRRQCLVVTSDIAVGDRQRAQGIGQS